MIEERDIPDLSSSVLNVRQMTPQGRERHELMDFEANVKHAWSVQAIVACATA